MVEQSSERPKDIDLGTRVGELEKGISLLQHRIQDLEHLVPAIKAAKKQSTESEDERVIVENMNGKYVQDSLMFSLLLRGQQTKEQIKKTLGDWGIPFGSWFHGGNMRNRLIKTGLVKEDGENESGEESYSLTIRGSVVAREKLDNLKKRKSGTEQADS